MTDRIVASKMTGVLRIQLSRAEEILLSSPELAEAIQVLRPRRKPDFPNLS